MVMARRKQFEGGARSPWGIVPVVANLSALRDHRVRGFSNPTTMGLRPREEANLAVDYSREREEWAARVFEWGSIRAGNQPIRCRGVMRMEPNGGDVRTMRSEAWSKRKKFETQPPWGWTPPADWLR